jgi:hypothetical protein
VSSVWAVQQWAAPLADEYLSHVALIFIIISQDIH